MAAKYETTFVKEGTDSYSSLNHRPSGRRDTGRPRIKRKAISEVEQAIRLIHKMMMVMVMI
jgi:hypothetical protein